MIEEIKQSNIIEYIKKMPLEERVIINSELCNFEKSDSMYLLEQNKALVEALESADEALGYCVYSENVSSMNSAAESALEVLRAVLTTYKGENT